MFTKNGIDFVKNLPINDGLLDQEEGLQQLFLAVEYLNDMLNNKELTVYVHSSSGYCRAATVVLLYLSIYENHKKDTEQQLVSSVQSHYPRSFPNMMAYRKVMANYHSGKYALAHPPQGRTLRDFFNAESIPTRQEPEVVYTPEPVAVYPAEPELVISSSPRLFQEEVTRDQTQPNLTGLTGQTQPVFRGDESAINQNSQVEEVTYIQFDTTVQSIFNETTVCLDFKPRPSNLLDF